MIGVSIALGAAQTIAQNFATIIAHSPHTILAAIFLLTVRYQYGSNNNYFNNCRIC